MNFRNRLIALNKKMSGDFLQMYAALKQDASLKEYATADTAIISESVVTIIDANYPACLKELMMPPFVLYYEGDLTILDKKRLGVWGSRKPSPYAQIICSTLLNEGDLDYVVVTNLDVGINALAIETYQSKGYLIGILASGLERKYPIETKDIFRQENTKYCLITEYASNVTVSLKQLQARQRLMVGLSEMVVCIEPPKGSDLVKMSIQALNQGILVYVVPDQLTQNQEVATFELIEQGASCLTQLNLFHIKKL